MRLLHTKKFELQEFGGKEVPQYAILSHVWGKEEVTLQDFKTNEATKLRGYEKVSKACSVAAADGFDYVWIDTCCIDKTSSAELSEALNSMYRWYQEAEECFAYLADVPQNSVDRVAGVTGPEFRKSRWFTRGWTLQELIAPLSVRFLDREWQEIGTKSDLQRDISEITGIPGSFLLGDDLRHASIAQRMSWASMRETTRIEDLAYCLMGLFGIYMPMLYGEGERAFIRLQEEIMKVSDDHSLFAWRSIEHHGGILANSPAAFADSGNIIPISPAYATSSPSTLSSRGIHLSLRFINNSQQGQGLAILHCTEIGKERMRLALHLRDVFRTNEDFVREQSTTLRLIDLEDINPSQHPLTSLYVRQWHPTRKRKWEDMEKCVIKLAGVDGQEVASRIANFDSNCELSDGFMIMNMAAIPDGILGRLLVVCKDGIFFQILLKKYGRFLSTDISTSTNSVLQHTQDLIFPEKEQNDQDRIVKVLGDGQHVHVAIKKRVLLLREVRCLTEVVEISYSSTLKGVWLEHIAILEKAVGEMTLLSYAAKRGLKTIVEHLLDRESTESISKDDLRTPLSWAAEGGQEAVVKHLLEKGAALESKDKNGRTPLSWAAGTGHVAIVRLLLAKDAVLEENEKNIGDRKPLSRAVLQRLLPAKGTKLDSRDSGGQTPLSWAAGNGHEAVVQLLLRTGQVKADAKDSWGRTPLSRAAKNGHEAVVQLLLRTGQVEADAEDNEGQTPLSRAAMNGHEAVVQLLLETGQVEADAKNSYGWTPLSYAAANGHVDVVKLLLEKGADVTVADNDGWTPLHTASFNGHVEVVKLLFEKNANVTVAKNDGGTPLHAASSNGHVEVVKLLLEKGAEVTVADNDGWTPLCAASSNGHVEVVKLLFEKNANVTVAKNDGGTPMHAASFNGHVEVVKLLLEKGAEVTVAKNDGWTPLHAASSNGHVEVVKLLLEKGAEATVADNDGWTPLCAASSNGHVEVVKLLFEKNANVTVAKNDGWTPLHAASSNGHVEVVKLLLEHEAEADAKDKYGRTPLSRAAESGHEADSKDSVRRTPLLHAAKNGNEATVKLLLATNRVNVDSKDYYNSTPLSIAARMGHRDVLALILTQCHRLNTKDNFNRTPLWWARRTGHPYIADLLLQKCKENGIIVQERDLPTTTISVPDDKCSRYCDVCVLGISKEDTYYYCSICYSGDFDICEECFTIKAHCLGQSHTLIKESA